MVIFIHITIQRRFTFFYQLPSTTSTPSVSSLCPHTSNTSHLFPCHPGTTPLPNPPLSSSLYLIPSCFAVVFPRHPPSFLPSPSAAANGAAHLLRQEVRSQREPGDSEPAGQLPVWTVSPGNTKPKLVLGERVR